MALRRVVFNVTIALVAACLGGDPVSFSPERDDRAMAAIASVWSNAGSTTTLSLCEDLAVALDADSCTYLHQVRGGGRGVQHEYEGAIGCGGCPLGTAAAVKGTFTNDYFGRAVAVAGTIQLVSDDPYEFPYLVHLQCIGEPCSLSGTLHEDGVLELDFDTGFGAQPIPLARTGAAACAGSESGPRTQNETIKFSVNTWSVPIRPTGSSTVPSASSPGECCSPRP